MPAKNNWWIKPSLIVSGVISIGRGVLQIAFQPDYWDPRSAIDYVAVIGTSFELFTLALGIWGIAIAQASYTQEKVAWKFGIVLTCISAILAGTVNLVEDAFGIKSIGFLFPIGTVALAFGLLVSGVAALRVAQMPRRIGWLILSCLIGLLFMALGGEIVLGLSLVALADTSGDAK